MKITFTQIYPEPGASFALATSFLQVLQAHLNDVGLEIDQLQGRYKTEFTLVLIIAASRTLSTVVARGPSYRRKEPKVEYAVWIPFATYPTHEEKLSYIATSVVAGLKQICQHHSVDVPDFAPALTKVLDVIAANPGAFPGWGESAA